MATANKKTTVPARRAVSTDVKQPALADNKPTEATAAALAEAASQVTVKMAKEQAATDMVTAVVPKAFKLTRDDHSVHEYHAGTQEMSRADAEHWFARACGVLVYDPEATGK